MQKTSQTASSPEVCEDILDTVTSYHKVSRKRFVDAVCQQVVFHFLLDCSESTIKIFSPEFVMKLTADELEMIAGEDSQHKSQRQLLEREIRDLASALAV